MLKIFTASIGSVDSLYIYVCVCESLHIYIYISGYRRLYLCDRFFRAKMAEMKAQEYAQSGE